MEACNDFKCKKCGTRISWFGELKNAPPCPKCGTKIPADELEYLQFVVDVIAATPEAKIASFEEMKAYWKAEREGSVSEERRAV